MTSSSTALRAGPTSRCSSHVPHNPDGGGSGGGGEDLRERWRAVYRGQEDDVRRLAREYPGERSLSLDLLELYEQDEGLAEALFADPDRVLRQGEAALAALRSEFDRVNLRVENHPGLLAPAGVRSRHVGELVTVEGTVAEADGVRARIAQARYTCRECGHDVRRRPVGLDDPDLESCPECGGGKLRRTDAEFVDVQRLRVVDDGGIDVYLDDDLVGVAGAQDRALVTGVVRLDKRAGNLFDFYLSTVGADVDPGERDRPADEEIQDLIRSRWEVI